MRGRPSGPPRASLDGPISPAAVGPDRGGRGRARRDQGLVEEAVRGPRPVVVGPRAVGLPLPHWPDDQLVDGRPMGRHLGAARRIGLGPGLGSDRRGGRRRHDRHHDDRGDPRDADRDDNGAEESMLAATGSANAVVTTDGPAGISVKTAGAPRRPLSGPRVRRPTRRRRRRRRPPSATHRPALTALVPVDGRGDADPANADPIGADAASAVAPARRRLGGPLDREDVLPGGRLRRGVRGRHHDVVRPASPLGDLVLQAGVAAVRGSVVVEATRFPAASYSSIFGSRPLRNLPAPVAGVEVSISSIVLPSASIR